VLRDFGLLGGGRLIKAAGLGLLRNVPFAGAMIASSNAAMLYSLGMLPVGSMKQSWTRLLR